MLRERGPGNASPEGETFKGFYAAKVSAGNTAARRDARWKVIATKRTMKFEPVATDNAIPETMLAAVPYSGVKRGSPTYEYAVKEDARLQKQEL